jgi:hypothetical protein
MAGIKKKKLPPISVSPIVEPDVDSFVDNLEHDLRSVDEILGNISNKKSKSRAISVTLSDKATPVIVSDKTALNAAEKSIRTQVKKIGLDHAAEMMLTMVELARTSTNDRVRLDAMREILDRTIGRAPMAPTDISQIPIVPTFNLIFGQALQQVQQNEAIDSSNFEIDDDEDAEEAEIDGNN